MRSRNPRSPEPFEDEELSAEHSASDDEVTNPKSEEYESEHIEAIGTNPWSEMTYEREPYEGTVEQEGDPGEYPNARIIPEIGGASRSTEAAEETWTEQEAGPSSSLTVDVRILWP